MMKKSMYQIIKKQNGEAFAQQIRNFDSGIFELQNLPQLIKYAGRANVPLLHFLSSLKPLKIRNVETNKTPFELLDEAGYNAFLADTLEKQNSIKKYFYSGDELCTFDDEGRFLRYHIIHAVKKDVDQIVREDFKNPEREDAYGTSVISIQIAKKGDFLKITNRYNHRVPNPDNTFYSNPDNIVEGLTRSLEKFFHLDLVGKAVIPDGYVYQNGQIFKYNYEKQNIYFGDDFYLKEGKVYPLCLDYELMFDGIIVNLKDKRVYSPLKISNTLLSLLEEEIKGKKLSIQKQDETKVLLANKKPLAKILSGRVVGLCFYQAKAFDISLTTFLQLRSLHLEGIEKVGDDFLSRSVGLRSFSAPNLKEAGNRFLSVTMIEEAFLPSLTSVGDESFSKNKYLKSLFLPELKQAGRRCFSTNLTMRELDLPLLEQIGMESMNNNRLLVRLSLPKLQELNHSSLNFDQELDELYAPMLKKVGAYCFKYLPKKVLISDNGGGVDFVEEEQTPFTITPTTIIKGANRTPLAQPFSRSKGDD